jgi:hypothetical protein
MSTARAKMPNVNNPTGAESPKLKKEYKKTPARKLSETV